MVEKTKEKNTEKVHFIFRAIFVTKRIKRVVQALNRQKVRKRMYESPIDVIYSEVVTNLEDGVLKAVQDVGITVDKEELIKALQYDRDQYQKGYEDAVLNKTHGEWVDKWHTLWKKELPMCSVCNSISIFKSDYCPNCGARMDERRENER